VIVFRVGGGKACPFVSKRLHWPGVKKSKSALGGYIRIGLCEDVRDTLDDAVTD
jgi:hypothetical protein